MCGKRCVVTGKDTENLSANAAVMFCTRCSLIREVMGGRGYFDLLPTCLMSFVVKVKWAGSGGYARRQEGLGHFS